MQLECNEQVGAIHDGDIRYLLMRPDVLMGTIKNLDQNTAKTVLNAFQQAAFDHGKASMHHYKNTGFSSPIKALEFVCKVAAKLGWGRFSYHADTRVECIKFKVENSPFAAGYGQCDQPVCAPIAGILGATVETFFEKKVTVTEITCASQGDGCCRFEVRDMPC